MRPPPDRCPNPECANSLGGPFERSQYERVGDEWHCRECGYVREV